MENVFLYDEPTLDKLKACSFFWKNVVVYESYLSDVVEQPDLVDVTRTLFKKDILKICETPKNLKNALTDKIYCTLDKELWEYLYNNPARVTVEPKLPRIADEMVKESTRKDSKDPNLRKLIDRVMLTAIESKWLDSLRENERFPFDSMSTDMKKAAISEARKLAKLEYGHHRQLDPKTRYGFEFRNRYLLEQISVSTALFTPMAWLPYYQYKFGDYSTKDARKYLQGLDAVMPFVRRNSIDAFSIEDILKIRRNRKWNNAMNRLACLCNEVKYGADVNQFRKEIEQKVMYEYQDALGEKEANLKDLGKQLAKGSAFAGISFVPIIGPIASTVVGLADPIVTYIQGKRGHRSLPFFLNDLRKM